MATFFRAIGLGLLLITVAEAFGRPGMPHHDPNEEPFHGCDSEGEKEDACLACMIPCVENGNDLCGVCATEDHCYPICLATHSKFDVDNWVNTCEHTSLCNAMKNEDDCMNWGDKGTDWIQCNWVKRDDGDEECEAPCGSSTGCGSCKTQDHCSATPTCTWNTWEGHGDGTNMGECEDPERGCEEIDGHDECSSAGCTWHDEERCRKPCSGRNCETCSNTGCGMHDGCTWEEGYDSQEGHCSPKCSSDNCWACDSTSACNQQKDCVAEGR